MTDADRENEIMKSDNITVDTMLYSLASKRQKTSEDELPYGVQERLDNIESHLKLSGKVDQKALLSFVSEQHYKG